MSSFRIVLAVTALIMTSVSAWGQQPFALVKSKLADIHVSPSETSARQTQALYGEVVDILNNRLDGWTSISLHWQKRSNGGIITPIIGWTRTTNLVIPPGKTREEYTRNSAILFNPSKGLWVPLYERVADGLRFVDLCPEGTLLPITRKSESEVTILLADGREGVVSASNVRMLTETVSHADFAAALIFHAEKFLGKPVMAGGMGLNGIDGSGLVHLASRIAGRLLPRDEVGISDALRAKDKSALVTGDIVMLQHAFSGQLGTALFAGPNEAIGAVSTNIVRFSLDDRTWLSATWRGFADARAPEISSVIRVTTNIMTIVQQGTNATKEDFINHASIVVGEKTSTTNKTDIPLQNTGIPESTHSTGWDNTDQKVYEITNSSPVRIDRSEMHTTKQDVTKDQASQAGPSMYTIHLGSMLVPANAVRLLNAVKHTSLPVFVTVKETPQGQFLSVNAGWFADPDSARQAHARNLLIQRVAPEAGVRSISPAIIPWSAGMRLYSVQVMSLKNPHVAMDSMRDLARLGLGPVLRYIPLADGHFWSVLHCAISPDRAKVAQRVRDLTARSRWKPIQALFP
jgi:cell wall-associated NlpC family hydrolase